MRASTAAVFTLVATLAPQALAGVFVTKPVAGNACTAGTACTVSWNDDGKAPLLAAIGLCTIGLYAGNAQQQTQIQSISDGYDMSRFGSIDFLPLATAGPNFDQYFIRIQAVNFMDPATSAPYQSFSAKFALTGMTGQFSPAVSSQIAGVTSAGTGPVATTPVVGTTPVVVSTAVASPNSTTPSATGSSPSKPSGSASGSAKPSASSNAAIKLGSVGAAGAFGAIAAMLFGVAI